MAEVAVVTTGYVLVLAIVTWQTRATVATARRERLKTRIVVCIGSDPTGMPTAADLADELRIDVDNKRLDRALVELRAEGAIKAYMADGPGTYRTARGNVVGPLHYRLKGT